MSSFVIGATAINNIQCSSVKFFPFRIELVCNGLLVPYLVLSLSLTS